MINPQFTNPKSTIFILSVGNTAKVPKVVSFTRICFVHIWITEWEQLCICGFEEVLFPQKEIWSANRKSAFHNVFWAPNGTRLSARCHLRGPKKLSISRAQPPSTFPRNGCFFYFYFLTGYRVSATPSLMSTIYDFWGMSGRTQSAAVASWRVTDLATHRNGCCPYQKHYARGRINHRCMNS